MRKYILLIAFSFAVIFAQGGKYAGDFLDQGIGVRALGLGQAYSASATDISAIYYNPAGLSLIGKREAYMQYTDLYEGLAYHHFIGYNHPLFGGWAIAAGWMRVGVDDIQKTVVSQQQLGLIEAGVDGSTLNVFAGSFSNANDAYYLSIGKNNAFLVDLGWQYFEMPIEIPIGVTFKYINQTIDDFSGSALGFDIGAMIRFKLSDFLNTPWLGTFAYSLSAKDILGTSVKWDTENQTEDEIPMHFFHGIEVTQPVEWLYSEISLLYMYDSKYDGLHNLGFEFAYNELIAARVGYRDDLVTFGAGLHYWILTLDYAMLPHDLGNTHRVALKVGF